MVRGAMTDLLDPPYADQAVLELPAAEPARPRRAPRPTDGWMAKIGTASPESWITFLVVVGASVFVFFHLQPALIFANTTPTGGDFGAHVWGPAYLRDHLLPHLRLSGWAPDWYAGFPMYRFYMLPPALAVVALDVVAPYGISLKIVSILGLVGLPIAAYTFGRLAGLRFPYPPLLALAAVMFLFDETFTIYGGNIASTMAGEFSFSIALTLAVFHLGVLVYGMRTGKHRALAAVLLALTLLCHLLVAFFAIVSTVVVFVLYADRHRFRYLLTYAIPAGLASLFWLLPFWWDRAYMTDMGYERGTNYWSMLFPHGVTADRVFFGAALVGLIGSILKRRRVGVFLGATALIYGVWAVLQPQGHLWNFRLLPFLYLCEYFIAAIGVGDVLGALAALLGRIVRRWRVGLARGGSFVTVIAAALAVTITIGMGMRWLPGGVVHYHKVNGKDTWTYEWLGLHSDRAAIVDDWARWNFTGYERKPAYGEYYALMNEMKRVGASTGCGRAEWEYDKELNRYGTTMSLMLLPFWTDGCIDSMEGLFFEASGTTPFHFITVDALSTSRSQPVRKMPYLSKLDVNSGVKFMQRLGVRYYLAFTPEAVKQASVNPDLTEVGASGPWHVYLVADSALVSPLSNQPVVVKGTSNNRVAWIDMAAPDFVKTDQWSIERTDAGPASWQRISADQTPTATPLTPVTVSDIKETNDSISFKVDRPGIPVLVRTSYFPNWKVSGGKGPYRATPDFMVVIPESTHVTLHYGRSPIELVGMLASLIGLAGIVLLWRRGAIEYPTPPEPDRLSDEAWLGLLAGPPALLFDWEDTDEDGAPFPLDAARVDHLRWSDTSDVAGEPPPPD